MFHAHLTKSETSWTAERIGMYSTCNGAAVQLLPEPTPGPGFSVLVSLDYHRLQLLVRFHYLRSNIIVIRPASVESVNGKTAIR
jgi:hypothetical protein